MAKTLEKHLQNPRTPTEREAAKLGPWFQNLHLPDGTQTAPEHPLGDFPAFKWRALAQHLPRDLSGWTVLDIGCNAGFYAIELARRGAEVTAIDVDERYLRQARWATAQHKLSEAITYRQMQVYDLARLETSYDLVLFLGVFYHLRYPLLGLDLATEKAKRFLVFQSLLLPEGGAKSAPADLDYEDRERMLSRSWPSAAFVEHHFAGDPTNWWVPNRSAAEALLRSAGLRILSRPTDEMYLCAVEPDLRERRAGFIDQLRAVQGMCGRAAKSEEPGADPSTPDPT